MTRRAREPNHVRRAAIAIAVSMLLGGCTAGTEDDVDDDDAAPSATSIPSSEPTAPPASVSVPSSGPPSSASTSRPDESPSTTAPPLSSTTTTTTIAYPSAADELGLAPIEQHTDVAGGGVRPVLEWSAVDAAARYHVVILAPSRTVYWAWETTETSVPVGGLPVLTDDAPGPAISEGMTWSVSAVDDSGHVIALSAHRPISP